MEEPAASIFRVGVFSYSLIYPADGCSRFLQNTDTFLRSFIEFISQKTIYSHLREPHMLYRGFS
jgi:hypothetical protein